MAEIAPFRGLRYNPVTISDIERVVIPPYDVISPEEQRRYHELDRHNMIRLELALKRDGDSEADNPHTRAAETLRAWRARGVLTRDPEPAIYYYRLKYSREGETRTREGYISLLRLEPFASGKVRPHEKTFSEVKSERLQLMLNCHANLSPIFALYNDPSDLVAGALRSARSADPDVAFRDENNMEHRLWRIVDPGAIARVRQEMTAKTIFIADGHHRYETALNYREIMRARYPNAGPDAPFDYVMVYLANMQQEGLTILPTHRLLKRRSGWNVESMLETARPYFKISAFVAGEDGRERWRAALEEAGRNRHTAVGFFTAGLEHYYLLEARHEAIDPVLAAKGIPEALWRLDVVVLDQVLLRAVLRLDDEQLGDPNSIRFHHSLRGVLDEIRQGSAEWAFLVNPTRIDQVEYVARSGRTMPHKATYFFPKVISGLVIYPLEPAE